MSTGSYSRVASFKDAGAFKEYLQANRISIPCDAESIAGSSSPLARPLRSNDLHIGNRFAINPMEGWDGTPEGAPSELTVERWRRFGSSGAKLIWGGEAVAVRQDGRANPNQLVLNESTLRDIENLRHTLVMEHRRKTGSTEGLLIGLQLTHSGRYSKPSPKILHRHPVLDKRLGLTPDYPLLTDGDIREIIEDYLRAAQRVQAMGFDFVDIKHCHGYLGHEFLGAHTREGDYGGSFENRTRFLREIVQGVRTLAPGLHIGVRFCAADTVPYDKSGSPENGAELHPLHPYKWGFGVDPNDPEPVQFLESLRELNIRLVNITAGSPYYNPHVQRPALFPPSDGYAPPEDPLMGVARQMNLTRNLKSRFPDMWFVGTAYSYLQEYLPHVAQAAVREGWVDSVGLGRMILSYPDLPFDVLEGRPFDRKRLCRTFSDCTTAPRKGLPSGCYPLDPHYRNSEAGLRLKEMKEAGK